MSCTSKCVFILFLINFFPFIGHKLQNTINTWTNIISLDLSSCALSHGVHHFAIIKFLEGVLFILRFH